MKSFIKHVFSSAIGVLLAVGVLGIIGCIIIIGIAASSNQTASIGKNSILHIVLKGDMCEQMAEDPINDLLGIAQESLSLSELREALKKAKNMDEIKGIFLEGGSVYADPASLEELRKCLADFKKSDKFVFSYADDYTQGSYYVCSLADKIAINPEGSLDWKGLSSQPTFYKDVLAKFGVKVQIFKVGTFKSAVEPFIRTDMSVPNRLQVNAFLNSIWGNFVADVSKSRRIPADSLQAYADRYTGMASTKDLLKMHLIDNIAYIDEAKSMLKKFVNINKDEKLSLVSPSDVCQAKSPDDKSSNNKIAIYYASGEIYNEAPQAATSAGDLIVATSMISDLDELKNDDAVKAVVLRINSPGGSAYASEQIWRAVKQLGKEKPVIVSMGGYAASGGYYISSASQYIVAEPTTLTGSIGIFGMLPDASGLLQDKLGFKYDKVNTNKMSDFYLGNFTRPLTPAEGELIQGKIEKGYQLFMRRVAEGRKMSVGQVDSIGQGRVWTGEQAIKIGLVDKLGTLDDAVKQAVAKAKLGNDYETEDYPIAEPWYMTLLDEKKESYYESHLRETLGDYYKPFTYLKTLWQRDCIQARLPYEPNIR